MLEDNEQRNDSVLNIELEHSLNEELRTERVARIFQQIYPLAAKELSNRCDTVAARTSPWKFKVYDSNGERHSVPRPVSDKWLNEKATDERIADEITDDHTSLTPLEKTQLENFAAFLVRCLKERKRDKSLTGEEIASRHQKTLSKLREDEEVFYVKQLVKNLVRGPNVKAFLAEWARFEKAPAQQPEDLSWGKREFSRLEIAEDIENKALLISKAIDAINSSLSAIDHPNLAKRFWKAASRSDVNTLSGTNRARFRKTSNIREQLPKTMATDFYRPLSFGVHPSFPEVITETSTIPSDAEVKRVRVTTLPDRYKTFKSKEEAADFVKEWMANPSMMDTWYTYGRNVSSIAPKDRNLIFEVEEQGITKYYAISLSNLLKHKGTETRPEFQEQTLSEVLTEATVAIDRVRMITAREEDGFIPLTHFIDSIKADTADIDSVENDSPAQRELKDAIASATVAMREDADIIRQTFAPTADTKSTGYIKPKNDAESPALSSAAAGDRVDRMERVLKAIIGTTAKTVAYPFGNPEEIAGIFQYKRKSHWRATSFWYSLNEPSSHTPYYFDRKREEEKKSGKVYRSGGFATLKPSEERILIEFMDYLHIALGRLPEKDKKALANNSRLNHRASSWHETDWPALHAYICKQCLKQLVRSEHRQKFFDAWREAHAVQENWPKTPNPDGYSKTIAHDKFIPKWQIAASAALNMEDILVKGRGDTFLTALTQNTIRARVLGFAQDEQHDKRLLHPSIKAQSLNLDTDFCKGIPYGASDLFPRKITDVSHVTSISSPSPNDLSDTGPQSSNGFTLKSARLSDAFLDYLDGKLAAPTGATKEQQVWDSIEMMLTQYHKGRRDIGAEATHYITLEAEAEGGHKNYFQISIKDFLNRAIDEHPHLSREALHKMIYLTLVTDTKKQDLVISRPVGLIESFTGTDGYQRNGKIDLSMLAQRAKENLLPTQPIHMEIQNHRMALDKEHDETITCQRTFHNELNAIKVFDDIGQQQEKFKALETAINGELRARRTALQTTYGEGYTAQSLQAWKEKLTSIEAEHGQIVKTAWESTRKERYEALKPLIEMLTETRKHIIKTEELVQTNPPQANLSYVGEVPHPENVRLAELCKQNIDKIPKNAVHKGKPITVIFVSQDEHAISVTYDGQHVSVVPKKNLDDLRKKLGVRHVESLVSGEVLSFTPVSPNFLKAGAQKLSKGKFKI